MTSAVDPRRAGWDGGFTLIELLVVLSIVSLLLALAPQVSAGLSGARFRNGVTSVVGTLRDLHRQAERSGASITVFVRPHGLTWRSNVSERESKLPPGVDRIELSPIGKLQPDSEGAIHFFRDGSATSARLELWGGRHRAAIYVSWISGYVHADE